MTMKLPRDNKSSCEREVTFAPGQSLPCSCEQALRQISDKLCRTHSNGVYEVN